MADQPGRLSDLLVHVRRPKGALKIFLEHSLVTIIIFLLIVDTLIVSTKSFVVLRLIRLNGIYVKFEGGAGGSTVYKGKKAQAACINKLLTKVQYI